jgi:hypothetical protein
VRLRSLTADHGGRPVSSKLNNAFLQGAPKNTFAVGEIKTVPLDIAEDSFAFCADHMKYPANPANLKSWSAIFSPGSGLPKLFWH